MEFYLCLGVKNLNAQENADYECVTCLCHKVSGCYFKKNCAKYSINRKYWELAGSLVIVMKVV